MNEGKQMYADLMNLLLPLLPSQIYHDVRRVQTLAWALVGLCLTQTVRLGAWTEVVDSQAQFASSRVRRFARWLHQGAISPHQWYVKLIIKWLMATLDTGGEVEDPISGRLLHDPFEGRGAGLLRASPRSQLIN